ncbi:hypothetical protein BC828DRAFT_379245 [Blastocladiella britannica]|nr:hypothetical protein BC828DRAFT_379245 [Blastocladiella britannica]
MTSGDGIPAVVGRIALRLEPNPVELTKTLFISLIAEQADLESANDGLQSELTLARTERATAQDDLLRFAWAARERDDGNLLKLLELVNSKKFKIKQLEARLAHLEQKLARLGSDDDGRELGLLDSGNQLPVLATGHYKPLGTLVPARVEDPPVVSVRGKKGGATAAPRKRSAAAVKPARLAGPGGPSTTVGLLPEQRKRVIPEPAPPEDSDTASGGGNEAGDTDTE